MASTIKCPYCGYEFENSENYANLYKRSEGVKIKCNPCGKEFLLKVHIEYESLML